MFEVADAEAAFLPLPLEWDCEAREVGATALPTLGVVVTALIGAPDETAGEACDMTVEGCWIPADIAGCAGF